jgi:hypothetical protein
VDDIKKTYRDVEQEGKERWRERDGEDLADTAGNAGDEIRKDLGNAGDDLRRTDDEEVNRGEPAKP